MKGVIEEIFDGLVDRREHPADNFAAQISDQIVKRPINERAKQLPQQGRISEGPELAAGPVPDLTVRELAVAQQALKEQQVTQR